MQSDQTATLNPLGPVAHSRPGRSWQVQWPLIVLLVSIGLTAVAAYDAQRVVRTQRRVAQRALREYASFAAWSYSQHLTLALDAIGREVLGAVNHGDNLHTYPQVPVARNLPGYLRWDAACGCRRTISGPSPESFFAIDLAARTLTLDFNGVSGQPGSSGMYRSTSDSAGRGADDERAGARTWPTSERRWALDSLTARIRARPGLNRGFRFLIDGRPGAQRIYAYTLMPTAWGDTIVYGARYSAASLASILSASFDNRGLLPDAFTEGRHNRDVIDLAIFDRAGHPLFASVPRLASDLSSRVVAPASSDSLQVQAAVRPEIAGTLLIGGLPVGGMPVPLGLLALAAALSVIAVVQIRREGELARLRSDFVSSVSHELRTPVAQIRLYLDTLRLGRAASPSRREWALGHIERETTRLAYLVENVLRFSTLDGAHPVASDIVDPASATREIIDEFEPLAASRGASIELETTPTPPVRVKADALRHILVNLLDNAVKYGPSEQTIHVTVGCVNDQVAIAVRDEGPGIPPAERDLIWRPFMRGQAAAAKGGSGIGLSIVRELARELGGSVHIDAGVGPGACFVVTLPALRATADLVTP